MEDFYADAEAKGEAGATTTPEREPPASLATAGATTTPTGSVCMGNIKAEAAAAVTGVGKVKKEPADTVAAVVVAKIGQQVGASVKQEDAVDEPVVDEPVDPMSLRDPTTLKVVILVAFGQAWKE